MEGGETHREVFHLLVDATDGCQELLPGFPCKFQESTSMGHLSLVFPSNYQGAGLEVEQAGLLCGSGIAGGGFACSTMMPAPVFVLIIFIYEVLFMLCVCSPSHPH